jgi:hypothetical protein
MAKGDGGSSRQRLLFEELQMESRFDLISGAHSSSIHLAKADCAAISNLDRE